jgi:hypothetical protein
MRWCSAAVFLMACSFDDGGTSGAAQMPDAAPRIDAPMAIDGPPAQPDAAEGAIPHVPPDHATTGTGTYTMTSSTIDTSAMTIVGAAIPAGVTFDTSPQSCSGCPELAILHVGRLHIPGGSTIRVVGMRPFVILAGDTVDIGGVIDASAHAAAPGAGGAASAMGPGAGAQGVHQDTYSDSGGGGAGLATLGGKGGDAMGENTPATGAAGGVVYDDPMVTKLLGGSGGGLGSGGDCANPLGGAGGGALQIYSQTGINITGGGGINVGGGGGGAGPGCGTQNSGAGSGGGSGGMLFLQAPMITNAGFLAANGGSGGGGGSNGATGGVGQDGQLSATPATGGVSGGTYGGAGGIGAAGAAAPTDGGLVNTMFGGNGGGGGGSAGRIRALHKSGFTGAGMASPAVVVDTY